MGGDSILRRKMVSSLTKRSDIVDGDSDFSPKGTVACVIFEVVGKIFIGG
jgi:hypothetical protein